jgi:hypothetical protein
VVVLPQPGYATRVHAKREAAYVRDLTHVAIDTGALHQRHARRGTGAGQVPKGTGRDERALSWAAMLTLHQSVHVYADWPPQFSVADADHHQIFTTAMRGTRRPRRPNSQRPTLYVPSGCCLPAWRSWGRADVSCWCNPGRPEVCVRATTDLDLRPGGGARLRLQPRTLNRYPNNATTNLTVRACSERLGGRLGPPTPSRALPGPRSNAVLMFVNHHIIWLPARL